MNDLKQYPKCRAMVKALQSNQGYRRVRSTLVNAVSMEAPGKVPAHIIKEGPFAGVAFIQKS